MRRALFRVLVLAVAMAAPATAAPVPKVTAGPDLVERAQAIEAPITEVTVFSDRARVERAGAAKVGAGVHAVRLPDLPGGVLLDTVRVDAKGAKVLRVEATPVERPRHAIGQVEGLLEKLEEIGRTLARHDARRAVLLEEMGWLDALAPKSPKAEEYRKSTPAVDPGAWAQVRGFLKARRAALSAEVRAMDTIREGVVEEAGKLRAEISRYDQRAFSKRRTVQVLVLLDVKSANPRVRLEYFVPGASWRPAYKVELAGGGRMLTVRTAGRVQQATGEDWEGVELALSTAIPGQGIAAPELLTWTLGEAKDFTPKPQPEQQRPPNTLAPPQARQTLAEREHEQAIQTLRQRIQTAMAVGTQGAPEGYAGVSGIGSFSSGGGVGSGLVGGLGLSGSGRGGGGVGYGRAVKTKRARRPRRTASARPMPEPPPGAPMMMDAMAESAAMPSPVVSSLSRVSDGRAQGARTSLALFEPPSPGRPSFSDPTLPAAIAGGLDYVYRSKTRVTVPSSPEQHTVPLSAETHPVTTYYEASPGLQPTAYLKAKVKNRAALPILGGPVDIFSGADYVGTGTLETTGVGGDLELPLGADEDLEIVRRIIPKTVTEGVFSKDEMTRYRTEIEVANRKRRKVTVRIIEQYPITDVEDLSIDQRNVQPKPTEGPDERGVMTFELVIPAGKKKTVTIDYRIKRPENWRLWQQ